MEDGSMGGRGSLVIARLRGIPIAVHWSLPLSALLFSRLRFAPAAWLGLALVVLAHELGHAALVRRNGLDVERIELFGWGGECRHSGYATRWQLAEIAWGGVLAQALLLPLGYLLAPRFGSGAPAELLASFGEPSLFMIGLNLLPIPPLDGSRAWSLLGMAWRRRRAARVRNSVSRRGAALAKQRERAMKTVHELERNERVEPSSLLLEGEAADQVRRAVKRAVDEHEPRR
jgi:Zn-dependent protease